MLGLPILMRFKKFEMASKLANPTGLDADHRLNQPTIYRLGHEVDTP
jgi:hypothetical protein